MHINVLKEFSKMKLNELVELLENAFSVLEGEKQLIDLKGRVLVVGDTHGDVISSVAAFKMEADVYLFLGDYVDRGPYQAANINFLLSRKTEEPEKVILLRGNHESPLMNYEYGFYWEIVQEYGSEIYELYAKLFSLMPYAAIINSSVFAVHGGIARGIHSARDVLRLVKGDVLPSDKRAFELLWNDPDESIDSFASNPRGGGSQLFGRVALESFLEKSGLETVTRAHEYFPNGLHVYFDGKLISVFSCRYYPSTQPKAVLYNGRNWEILQL
ncbi:MAG: metallophosphoesterase [Thermofilaceae archaeon]